jgi:hypothetical protein
MPVLDKSLNLGAVSVKASTIKSVDNRPTIALSVVALFALAAFSDIADARSYGMMQPPAHMGMPPGPTSYPIHRPLRQGGDYASDMKAAPTFIDVASLFANPGVP